MDKLTSSAPGAKNVLNSDVEIKGDLKFSGEMSLDGKIDGDIRGEGTLVLGDTSVVNGNIDTHSASVRGKVNGNIVAKDKLEVKAKSEVFGDIRASKLVIEEGVIFVGKAEINPNKVSPSPVRSEPAKSPTEPARGMGR